MSLIDNMTSLEYDVTSGGSVVVTASGEGPCVNKFSIISGSLLKIVDLYFVCKTMVNCAKKVKHCMAYFIERPW